MGFQLKEAPILSLYFLCTEKVFGLWPPPPILTSSFSSCSAWLRVMCLEYHLGRESAWLASRPCPSVLEVRASWGPTATTIPSFHPNTSKDLATEHTAHSIQPFQSSKWHWGLMDTEWRGQTGSGIYEESIRDGSLKDNPLQWWRKEGHQFNFGVFANVSCESSLSEILLYCESEKSSSAHLYRDLGWAYPNKIQTLTWWHHLTELILILLSIFK